MIKGQGLLYNEFMNRNVLKILMMIFMTMDHVAFSFMSIKTVPFQVFRFFGRMVAPTMCYLLAEGFRHSQDHKKYLLRLVGFGVLAYLPYVFMGNRYLMFSDVSRWFMQPEFDMLFTLAICLVMLMAFSYIEGKVADQTIRDFCQLGALLLAIVLTQKCDWGMYAPVMVAASYRFKDRKWLLYASYAAIAAMVWYDGYSSISPFYGSENALKYMTFSWGMLGSIPLLELYDHNKGKLDLKYAFYIYYPLHLAVIDYIVYLGLKG